jgi:MFS family permease
MSFFASADIPVPPRPGAKGHTSHIAGFVYFTFICYVSIGLPLAVLPPFVHLRMGYSTVLAGLAISIQYLATVLSRFWAGRICDRMGAKVSVLWGMACCAASGAILVGVAALHNIHWLSFAVLIASRLVLGVGESLASTGSSIWGIASAGPEHTAKVINLNGISIYCGVALGAPLGVILDQQWGLASIGVLTILICAVSFALAWRKSPVAVVPGEHLPFSHVLGRVGPYGMSLALGSVGYCVLITFVALFYASRHWNGAALCLTVYGIANIAARVLFIKTVDHYGGFPVAMVSLFVTSVAMLMLWRAPAPWMALSGAALSGLGFALVFPALGVELVKRVPESNRGAVLGIYTAFFDVSFLLVGPVAGAIIGIYGYASGFLFALISVLASLGIVVVLRQMQKG